MWGVLKIKFLLFHLVLHLKKNTGIYTLPFFRLPRARRCLSRSWWRRGSSTDCPTTPWSTATSTNCTRSTRPPSACGSTSSTGSRRASSGYCASHRWDGGMDGNLHIVTRGEPDIFPFACFIRHEMSLSGSFRSGYQYLHQTNFNSIILNTGNTSLKGSYKHIFSFLFFKRFFSWHFL